MNRLRATILLLTLCLVAACAPVAKEYAGVAPEFKLDQFLTGELVGHGIFFDRSGRVKSRFKVEITGVVEGEDLALHETVTYVNGEIERRVWKIRKESAESYRATTGDVIGEASIANHGFAAQWNYQLALHVEGATYNLNFDDWMYLFDEHTMLNRATVTKWGFRVGEVMIAFNKK